ncbi:KH domain-containing protein [Roseofilum casamattae]|uniref:KH domain-containing protein n=1 Tax=Roseofilum casamattae BLCC-M143 TaxID=3022442 RepID=A0ABT7C2Y1_9CYAN|nr:KH domain-containing protein [Roseofilum casamattae]MDJ1185822.1 KH domain-containing protein [Roseofilum casamattae BLCC-M143]
MSLNNSKPQPQKASELTTPSIATTPDYPGLTRMLINPFLEFPEELQVDCETLTSASLVWIRVAFSANDKAKVYGRGGRNIEAIRTVLSTAAQVAGQSVYLDVYGGFYVSDEHSNDRHGRSGEGNPHPRPEKMRGGVKRPARSRPETRQVQIHRDG